MKGDIIRGKSGELFMQGYKGKGMCANCHYSYERTRPGKTTKMKVCGYYGSACELVSRNCPGIRILKSPNQ